MFSNRNKINLFFPVVTRVYEESYPCMSMDSTVSWRYSASSAQAVAVVKRQAYINPPQAAPELPLHAPALEAFVIARRNAAVGNDALSKEYEAEVHGLSCPLLLDFPLIPVRFNGRLYDFDQLMKISENGYIIDIFTRERIKLTPHAIQPDYTAQESMDSLLEDMKKKKQQVMNSSVDSIQVSRMRMWNVPAAVPNVAELKEVNNESHRRCQIQ